MCPFPATSKLCYKRNSLYCTYVNTVAVLSAIDKQILRNELMCFHHLNFGMLWNNWTVWYRITQIPAKDAPWYNEPTIAVCLCVNEFERKQLHVTELILSHSATRSARSLYFLNDLNEILLLFTYTHTIKVRNCADLINTRFIQDGYWLLWRSTWFFVSKVHCNYIQTASMNSYLWFSSK